MFTVGIYSGIFCVVSEISRVVFPTAWSPTTTSFSEFIKSDRESGGQAWCLGYRAGACGSAEDDDGWQDSELSKANADNSNRNSKTVLTLG